MDNNFNQVPQQDVNVQMAVDAAMQEQKKKKKKKRLITLGVIFAIILVIIIAAAAGSSDDGTNTDNSGSNSSNSITAEEPETVDGEIGDFVCTIKSTEICKDSLGEDAIRVVYSFTNNSSEAISFDTALSESLYQDGIALQEPLFSDNDDDTYYDVSIKPGVTKDVSKIYNLRDKETTIEVEIEELWSFNDDVLKYTIDLK